MNPKALADTQPKPPFPEQHQEKAGRESELKPRPRYQAPAYRAAGKDRGALVTGWDSGIGRAGVRTFRTGRRRRGGAG